MPPCKILVTRLVTESCSRAQCHCCILVFILCVFISKILRWPQFIIRTMPYVCVFSERELAFPFAICRSASVCRLSVCRMSVTFVHPTQANAIEIFGNVSTPFGTLAVCWHPGKILRRSSQGNPSVGGVKHKSGSRIWRFWAYRTLYLGNGAR